MLHALVVFYNYNRRSSCLLYRLSQWFLQSRPAVLVFFFFFQKPFLLICRTHIYIDSYILLIFSIYIDWMMIGASKYIVFNNDIWRVVAHQPPFSFRRPVQFLIFFYNNACITVMWNAAKKCVNVFFLNHYNINAFVFFLSRHYYTSILNSKILMKI